MKRIYTITFAILLGMGLSSLLFNPEIVLGQASSGGSGAGNPVYLPSLLFPDSDVDPDATGEVLYDNTVTGIANGALAWYSGAAIRYLVDLDTGEYCYVYWPAGNYRQQWNSLQRAKTLRQNGGLSFPVLHALANQVEEAFHHGNEKIS